MQIIDKILIKIFSKKVGIDQVGNVYFESNAKDYIGRKGRFVIYNGACDPTKISSEWYSWMHYLTNILPDSNNTMLYNWQKARDSNKTGSNTNDQKIVNWEKKYNYIKWQPK
jgi:NADH:ubiquinone oxidoreductase subunit